MQRALHPVHGDNTSSEPTGSSGSFRIQELGPGLGEGRTEIKHVLCNEGFKRKLGQKRVKWSEATTTRDH